MTDRSVEDVLAAVLAAYQVRAMVSDNDVQCGDWVLRESKTSHATFHLVADGGCWLQARWLPEPLALGPGDLVVFPQGSAHLLSARLGDAKPPPRTRQTTFICADLTFTRGAHNPLFDALPEHILVRHAEGGDRFRALAQVLRDEMQHAGVGSRSVMDKLADALFVMALRHHIGQATDTRGLIAALLDERLARALAAMHNAPAQDWTVQSLAQEAAMSRTAFAGRFAEVLGASPIQYLTNWRMTQAERLLQDRRLSVAAVAEQVGYQTEAAFRRSFKRFHGYGPGKVRREAQRPGERFLPTA